MGIRCGLVGLPNVGKSTLFNALTRSSIAAENFPFCTIEPNTGVVGVPDERLNQLAGIVGTRKTIPSSIEFVDIAGLIAGAAQGEGLGNQFLGHIRDVDLIVHVVRCFEDSQVQHVAERVDPGSDIEVVNTELILADLQSVERQLQKQSRMAKGGDDIARQKVELLERAAGVLDEGRMARSLDLSDSERALIKDFQLLSTKLVFYIANTADTEMDNAHVRSVQETAEVESAGFLPLCARIEWELSELAPDDQREMLQSMDMKENGLEQFVRYAYKLLGLETFFTAGVKEVRAWPFPAGTAALRAAGIIHTDFERGFIRAEVISYADFVQYKGEQGARDAGQWRLEGKEYVVADGDVIHFRFKV